ncbi:hypothetical protein LLE67_17460 [Xanthomonas campestris]|uniref:hypothetical protein n=1 Tax=Xanthomonas campestris TaxID=339 RepID=UPI001E551E54|nr:hypothetical protein [Xanthomonas campestris]MCC5069599.1 hypothetical protein [Xanthomonas campestris]
MDQQKTIMLSAALRRQGKFRNAIDAVSAALASFDSTYLALAYRELFLAAAEGGFDPQARQYAEIVLLLEPGLPSALKYLGRSQASG